MVESEVAFFSYFQSQFSSISSHLWEVLTLRGTLQHFLFINVFLKRLLLFCYSRYLDKKSILQLSHIHLWKNYEKSVKLARKKSKLLIKGIIQAIFAADVRKRNCRLHKYCYHNISKTVNPRDVDPHSFGSLDPDLYFECGSGSWGIK